MKHDVEQILPSRIALHVLDALDGGVVLLDGRRRVLAWNDWMSRTAGIAADGALGRDLGSLFPDLVGTRLWAAIDDTLVRGLSSLLTQGLNPSLLPLRRQDGRDLLHSVIVRRLPGQVNGEVLCLLQVTDVTASVERERLLRDRRDARHRAVVDTAADAIVTTDPDGTIRWMNPAAARQFGYAAEMLEGEPIGRLLGTDSVAWRDAAPHGSTAAVAAPVGVTGRRSDGSTVDLELSLSLWRSGGRSYLTGILRDVTERRRQEDRLQKHNQRALLLAQAAAQLLAASDSRSALLDLFSLIAGHLRLDAFLHYAPLEDGSGLQLVAHGGLGEEAARAGARLRAGQAVCGHVALLRAPAHLADIRGSDDERTALLRHAGLDAYACSPLVVGERLLGTLGFGRRGPDSAFDEDELRFLRTICHYVAMAQERLRAQEALRASEERLRLAVEGTGMATWDLDLATGRAIWSHPHFTILGYEPVPSGAATIEMWRSRVHPEDLPAVDAHWARAEAQGGLFRAEFRIRRADTGAERWIDAYGRFLQDDDAARRFIGVFFDITERKEAEERQKLLMREVDHRAKNALAVVRSVLRLTRTDDPKRFAETVEGRVAALARAHTLLAQDLWTGAGLGVLVEQELAAYRGGGRVVISGPPMRLAPDAVQPLSMALHELATNAAKYGALSGPGGRVEVSWRTDPASGNLHLRWAEHDGPPILMPPERRGFGSTLVEATVRGQLGGKAEIQWELEGLRCEITIAGSKLIRETPAALGNVAGEPTRAEPTGGAVLGVSLRRRRVLVAEDEPLVALELHQMLTRLGCEVLGPAATLEEALALAAVEARNGIDAAVLDINLHGRMIFPLVDLLAGQGVPVVYASGYGEVPDHRADRDRAVLLRKPVNDSDLEAALRQVVGASSAGAPEASPAGEQHPGERPPVLSAPQ